MKHHGKQYVKPARYRPTGMGLYDLMGKQAVMADGKAIVRERVEKIDGGLSNFV